MNSTAAGYSQQENSLRSIAAPSASFKTLHSNMYSDQLQPPVQQKISRDIIIMCPGGTADSPPPLAQKTSYGVPLYSYQQVPPYLKGNPHITFGYRAHIPVGLCVKR